MGRCRTGADVDIDATIPANLRKTPMPRLLVSAQLLFSAPGWKRVMNGAAR